MENNIKVSTIRKNSEISAILQTGRSLSNDCYTIKYVKTKDEYQFAIATSKKIFKTAVQRNRIKRQIRTFVQKIVKIRPIKFLIIVKKQYLTNTYIKNSSLFQDLINKIKE